MKIVVFVHYLPPHVGGIEVVADGQARALAEDGQDVEVVTSACGSNPGAGSFGGYTAIRIRAWNFLEEKIGAVFPIFAPSLLWHSYRAVKNADVVHVHDSFYLSSLAGAFWARLLGKPLVLTQHVDLVPHSMKIIILAEKLVYATIGRFILRSSKSIIVVNSRVKNFLKGMGVEDERILFLPNSVDTSVFTPCSDKQRRDLRTRYDLPKDKMLALFIGRFVHKKGFDTLLRVEPVDKLDLVFAGGNAMVAPERKNEHHFIGAIDHDAVPGVFQMCDIFVLPSRGEGFPVTVQEAMASGLPIITTDDPAYDLYELDASLVSLVEPTAKEVGAALVAIVSDSSLRKRMAEYSRSYALKNFATDSHISRLLSIYRDAATLSS